MIDELLHPQSSDLFLGIDGGGTKTEFVLVTTDGRVQKRLLKSGSNPNDIGYQGTLEIVLNGITEIPVEFQSIKAVFVGISGITVGNYSDRLCNDIKMRYPQIDVEIKSDSFNLFALDDTDMAVISGTGSVAFARKGNDYYRIGDWGYLLDRAGSAYDIGRDALCAALIELNSKYRKIQPHFSSFFNNFSHRRFLYYLHLYMQVV